jgi:hypothetical protein
MSPFTLKVEAAVFCGILVYICHTALCHITEDSTVYIYHTALCHIPEDSTVYCQCHEHLKS